MMSKLSITLNINGQTTMKSVLVQLKKQIPSEIWNHSGPRRQSTMKRFLRFVKKTRNHWLWIGASHNFGYGAFAMYIRNKYVQLGSHRASWILFRGSIPRGKSVLHRCNVPRCVRPSHLYLGTQADNMNQMIQEGRHRGPTTGKLMRFPSLRRLV